MTAHFLCKVAFPSNYYRGIDTKSTSYRTSTFWLVIGSSFEVDTTLISQYTTNFLLDICIFLCWGRDINIQLYCIFLLYVVMAMEKSYHLLYLYVYYTFVFSEYILGTPTTIAY